MPDHAHKTLDIVRKPRFNALRSAENHPNPLYLNGNRLRYLILKSPNLRPSDSVVLEHFPEKWTPVSRKRDASKQGTSRPPRPRGRDNESMNPAAASVV